MPPSLSNAELFTKFFWPLYPGDAKADLARARTTDANPAGAPAVYAHLEDGASVFAARSKALFGEELGLDFTDASVHRLGAALTRERRDTWAVQGEPGTAANELFNVVVHGVLYVGACVLRGAGKPRDASWLVRRPLWESQVSLRSPEGEAHLAIFQWWIKALSDEGLPGGGDARSGSKGTALTDRYRAHVEAPTFDGEGLTVIAPPERRLPRIAKGVRYDVLHKHLKAHLPELRDLGVDFPSPERFAEYRFRWLDFAWIKEGRLLLVYGAGEGGVHLFWLGAGGFVKGAHVPCDAFPEPIVKVGDKIVIAARAFGEDLLHELRVTGP